MADEAGAAGVRRRRRGAKHKRKNHRRANLIYNLAWVLGGLAVGLPLLGMLIYALSR